jgi:ATP-binding cassette subfamily C (CFTR/MRP) protein 1
MPRNIMTDPAQQKQEFAPTDPAAAVDPSNEEESLGVDGYEKDYIEIATHGQSSSHTTSETGSNGDDKKPAFDRTKSYATNTSAVTRTDSHVDEPAKKASWYRRLKLNPLRWGGIPPVPETRKVCREYNAPFLSLVYFQWVAPLMSASLPFIPSQYKG